MKSARVSIGLAFSATLLTAAGALCQPPPANEDESKVPPYTLPDPLVLADGKKVSDAKTWTDKRRPELLRLFESQVYGRTPAGGPRPRFQVGRTDAAALGGRASRREVAITFGEGTGARRMDLVLFVPKAATAPVPVFLALSFQRNDALKAP